MTLDVIIPPKWEAVAAASTSEIRAETDSLVLHVFCDGSFKRGEGGIGIVVNVWPPQSLTKQRASRACFIPCRFPDDNNTTEAFALIEGALFTLDQISSIKTRFSSIRSTTTIEVVFWSDSQSILRALEDPRRALSFSKKMQHLLDIIKLKTRELHESSADVSVKFHWCPEECVEPHATADRLSKEARTFGSNKYSTALHLFLRVPHKEIKAALNRPQRMTPRVPATQSSSLGVGSTSTVKAAELSGQWCSSLSTTNTGSRRPTCNHALILDLALGTITEDPVMMTGLYRAACTPKFFSIVDGVVEYLSPDLRASIHEAIRKQQEANKQARWYVPIASGERGETYERYPNLFALIEIAASSFPADQKKKVLDAIALQKDIIKSVLQNEPSNQIFEHECNDEVEVQHKPEDLKELKNLDQPQIMKEPVKIVEEVEIEVEPAKIVDEPMDLDKHIMNLDEPHFVDEDTIIQEPHKTVERPTGNTEEAAVLEDSETLDGAKVLEQPEEPVQPEVLEEPQVLAERGIFEQARPNRMRVVWNWVGRRFQHL